MIEIWCPFCEETIGRSRVREVGMAKTAIHAAWNHHDEFPGDDRDGDLPELELEGECISLRHRAIWAPSEQDLEGDPR